MQSLFLITIFCSFIVKGNIKLLKISQYLKVNFVTNWAILNISIV